MEQRPHIPLTSRARVALAIARAIAAGRGERDLTPLHLTLGLLREGENAALAVLHHQGVDVRRLRGECERALGEPSGRAAPDEVALPLTPGEAQLVATARAASAGLGDEYVGPEHLLLALLASADPGIDGILAPTGLTRASTVAAMQSVIHRH